ncbi:MAG: rRNA maturation RNase YbeY [Planctomycetota bacterium]
MRARPGPAHGAGEGPPAASALAVRVARVPGGRVRLARTLARLAAIGARRAGRAVDLSFALVGDDEMARLNERFRGRGCPTDVLAFCLAEGPVLLGEVVVSAQTARREAARRGLPAYDEVVLYAVHGVMHLLGYDDHDPVRRRRMRRAEREVLAALGLAPVYRRRRATT